MKTYFPKNECIHNMIKRNHEPYKITFASTERYKKSSIIYMQKLLNEEWKEKSQII